MVALAEWYSNSPYSFAKCEFTMLSISGGKKCTDPRCMSACRRGGWTVDAALALEHFMLPAAFWRGGGISFCRMGLMGARRRLFPSFIQSQQRLLCSEPCLVLCPLALSPWHSGSSREGQVAEQCSITLCKAPWTQWELCQCKIGSQ